MQAKFSAAIVGLALAAIIAASLGSSMQQRAQVGGFEGNDCLYSPGNIDNCPPAGTSDFCYPDDELDVCVCYVEPGTLCDSGNGICAAGSCVSNPCGNDVIDDAEGEDCDGIDDAMCPGRCIPPGEVGQCTCPDSCGIDLDLNGSLLDPGEECDYGALNGVEGHAGVVGTRSCKSDCTWTACSDGVDNDDDGHIDINDAACYADTDINCIQANFDNPDDCINFEPWYDSEICRCQGFDDFDDHPVEEEAAAFTSPSHLPPELVVTGPPCVRPGAVTLGGNGCAATAFCKKTDVDAGDAGECTACNAHGTPCHYNSDCCDAYLPGAIPPPKGLSGIAADGCIWVDVDGGRFPSLFGRCGVHPISARNRPIPCNFPPLRGGGADGGDIGTIGVIAGPGPGTAGPGPGTAGPGPGTAGPGPGTAGPGPGTAGPGPGPGTGNCPAGSECIHWHHCMTQNGTEVGNCDVSPNFTCCEIPPVECPTNAPCTEQDDCSANGGTGIQSCGATSVCCEPPVIDRCNACNAGWCAQCSNSGQVCQVDAGGDPECVDVDDAINPCCKPSTICDTCTDSLCSSCAQDQFSCYEQSTLRDPFCAPPNGALPTAVECCQPEDGTFCGDEQLDEDGRDDIPGNEDDEECDLGELNGVTLGQWDCRHIFCYDDCKIPRCGDGRLFDLYTGNLAACPLVGVYEQCDDGNNESGDGCSAECLAESCGDGEQDDDGPDDILGTIDDEECDDGDNDSGDGCSSDCKQELCGDGILQRYGSDGAPGYRNIDDDRDGTFDEEDEWLYPGTNDEECDTGALNSDTEPDACRTNCRRARCGDWTLDTGEFCDAPGEINPQACVDFYENALPGFTLQPHSYFYCQMTSPDQFSARSCTCQISGCGDGEEDAGEECDDGNFLSNDGCTPECRLEHCGDGETQDGIGETCDPGYTCHDGSQCNPAEGASACADATPCILRCDGTCSRDCRLPTCLNGIVECGEACEPDFHYGCENAKRINCNPRENDIHGNNPTCLVQTGGCDAGTCRQLPMSCTVDEDCVIPNSCIAVLEYSDFACAHDRTITCDPDRDYQGPFIDISLIGKNHDCDDYVGSCIDAITGDLYVGQNNPNDGVCAGDRSRTCRVYEDCFIRNACVGYFGEATAGGSTETVSVCAHNNEIACDHAADVYAFGTTVNPNCAEAVDCGPYNACPGSTTSCEQGEFCDIWRPCIDIEVHAPPCTLECEPAIPPQCIVDSDCPSSSECCNFNEAAGENQCGRCDLCTDKSDCPTGQCCLGDPLDPSIDTCQEGCGVCGDGVTSPGEECDAKAHCYYPDHCVETGIGGCLHYARSLWGLPCDSPGICTRCVNRRCQNTSKECTTNIDCADINATCKPKPTEGCTGECLLRKCGNGNIDRGEECDNGIHNSDEPDAFCRTDCKERRCGDGIPDPLHNEACDEGNLNNNDPNSGATCRLDCTPINCGDGFLDFSKGEVCDFGSQEQNSCRSSICFDNDTTPVTPLESCTTTACNSNDPNAVCRSNCIFARCGDGIVDTNPHPQYGVIAQTFMYEFRDPEQCECDDFSLDCEVTHNGKPAQCTSCKLHYCGDGVLDEGEHCDEGHPDGDDDGPNCLDTCKWRSCGDGNIDINWDERCDDGSHCADGTRCDCYTGNKYEFLDGGNCCADGSECRPRVIPGVSDCTAACRRVAPDASSSSFSADSESDQSESSSSQQIQHAECIGGECRAVDGFGTNDCVIGFDDTCQPLFSSTSSLGFSTSFSIGFSSGPSHTVCRAGACYLMAGPGGNQCGPGTVCPISSTSNSAFEAPYCCREGFCVQDAASGDCDDYVTLGDCESECIPPSSIAQSSFSSNPCPNGQLCQNQDECLSGGGRPGGEGCGGVRFCCEYVTCPNGTFCVDKDVCAAAGGTSQLDCGIRDICCDTGGSSSFSAGFSTSFDTSFHTSQDVSFTTSFATSHDFSSLGPQEYGACVNGACVTIFGDKDDECGEFNGYNCPGAFHTDCDVVERKCVLKTGPGPGDVGCAIGDDTPCEPVHVKCLDTGVCAIVPGVGHNHACKDDPALCVGPQKGSCINGQCKPSIGGTGDCIVGEPHSCFPQSSSSFATSIPSQTCSGSEECTELSQCIHGNGSNRGSCEYGSKVCCLFPTECPSNSICKDTVHCPSHMDTGQECGIGLTCCRTNTYAACLGPACIAVEGDGLNECQPSQGCESPHTECQDGACVLVTGFGGDECQLGNDPICIIDHGSSSSVSIASSDPSQCPNSTSCTLRSDCIFGGGTIGASCGVSQVCCELPNDGCPSGSECRDGSLCPQGGFTTPSCNGNDVCCSYSHTVCIGEACVEVAGTSTDTNNCVVEIGCGIEFHTECSDGGCVLVSGEGGNECDIDLDSDPRCAEFFESSSSISNTIVSSSEPFDVSSSAITSFGVTSSASYGISSSRIVDFNSSSLPFVDEYTKCEGLSCVIVSGVGLNECDPDLDCGLEFHTVCNNFACETVEGAGANECEDLDDCRFFGSSSFGATSRPFGSDDDDGGSDDDDGIEGNDEDNGDNDDEGSAADDDDGSGEDDDGIADNDDSDDWNGCETTFHCKLGICRNGECSVCVDDSECIIGKCENGSCVQPSLLAAASICGNGLLDPGEECDDSNRRDNDGCTSTCLLEIGICGDSIVQSLLGEQCESSTHDPALPFACSNCRFLSQTCGDGTLDPGEECDRGILNSTEPDAPCRPDCSNARCGDGVLDTAEQCDDGNRLGGDDCNRYCVIEVDPPTETEVGGGGQVAADIAEPEVRGFERFAYPSISRQGGQFPGMQQYGFPMQPSLQQIPYQMPLAQLQPLIQSQGPIGDTGPAAVVVAVGGMAAGLGWVRRRKK